MADACFLSAFYWISPLSLAHPPLRDGRVLIRLFFPVIIIFSFPPFRYFTVMPDGPDGKPDRDKEGEERSHHQVYAVADKKKEIKCAVKNDRPEKAGQQQGPPVLRNEFSQADIISHQYS